MASLSEVEKVFLTSNKVFIIIHVVAYKEKQPVERKVIKHGRDKGAIDMSLDSSEAKTPQGGKVNVEELLKMVRQERPSHPRRRHKDS